MGILKKKLFICENNEYQKTYAMSHLYIFDEKGPASNYGIGNYIRNIISVCKEISIPITVVSLNKDGKEDYYTSDNGIHYIDIPLLKGADGKPLELDRKEERRKYCQYVVSVLETYIPSSDVICFHLNYTQDYFLAENLKSRWSAAKILLTVHYFTWSLALGGNMNRLAHIMSKEEKELSDFEQAVVYSALFEQKLFQLTDYIICLSHFSKQVLTDYYEISEKKLWLIPNGIKDTFQKIDKKIVRRKYHIPENEKMLLYVGRLDAGKGVQYLIEAFKKIAETERDCHLYIIGNGNFNDFLPLCYPLWRRISFCGKVLPKDVADFYRMSDIGILPSLTEQCSFVAIEMLMHGLPFIGTDSSGLDEMIIEGVNGYKIHLLEKEDRIDFPVEELSSRLDLLMRFTSLEKYEEQSRNLYLQKYTFERMQDKLCQLYTFCFEG